ncbi:MAG: DUF456 domain-containing protein [Mediterranea sp.]|jgi:uncharacterized protein YqgC (DUF456 family)|nr:DUF456 domain-containing protein [Mediterranea sp.]
MEIFWIIAGCVLMLLGLAGCFLPALAGPPLCYLGLLCAYATGMTDYTGNFLLITALVTIAVTVLDYLLPIWGVKRWGGSRWGAIGSVIGLLLGLPFGIVGILLGTFLGAVAGELLGGSRHYEAIRAGVGTLVGFVLSTLLKFAVCIVFVYYFITGLV